MVGMAGFEPTLAGLRSRGNNQASLHPVGVSDGDRTRLEGATTLRPRPEAYAHHGWSIPRGSNPDTSGCKPGALPLALGIVGCGPASRTPLNSAYETDMLPRASARKCVELVDPLGLEPRMPACRAGVIPFHHEPIVAGIAGIEPAYLRADNAVSTTSGLYAPQDGPGPCLGLTAGGGPGGIRTHTVLVLSQPTPAVGLRAMVLPGLERMAGFEPAPQGLEGPQAAVTPHSLRFGPGWCPGRTWTGVVHRSIDIRQLSKNPLLRARPHIWRQRQDSNLDPRALEARMLR